MVVVPHFIAKTNEVTRAVVRIIYEEKKPEVQVTAIEEEKQASRTNFSIFIASLPSEIREQFRGCLDRWMKAGYTIYWGKIGFSLRIPWQGKLVTIFDAYPMYASVFQKKWVEQYGFPAESYNKYRDALMESPRLGSVVVSGGRYPNYDTLTEEDVMLLLSSTDKLVNELWQMNKR